VNLHELVSNLIIDTKGTVAGGLFTLPSADSSLGAFLPELCLCVTMVLLLLVRIFNWGRRVDATIIVLLGTGLATAAGGPVYDIVSASGERELHLAAPWNALAAVAQDPDAVPRMEIFTGMLVYDPLTMFMRSVLVGFAFLFAIFTKLSGIPDREDGPDIYTLVLGATLGMCLMASANHLLMIFMAVEMASVPSYVLAGMMKGRRLGSEAALKYSIFGAGAAGVMLYGISLLAGLLHTAHLPTMAVQLASKLPEMSGEEYMVLALGGLLTMVGLAFKLSAVPFHFWCPDVFEGATAEVNAFLSVASKAAALALLVRVAIGFSALPPTGVQPGYITQARESSPVSETAQVAEPVPSGGEVTIGDSARVEVGLFAIADDATVDEHQAGDAVAVSGVQDRETVLRRLAPARDFIGKLIAFFAIITCTFGNLAAYGQTNIKRLFAYSTIAHAGYMIMPVSALVVMSGYNSIAAESAVSAIALYVVVYLFMNLGAFAIIAFLRNAMRSEEIADYAGLIRRCPVTVICFALILFSLVGLPPLAGFIGKFAVFAALVDGYRVSSEAGAPANYLMVLLVAGGLNTAISLFYYLRVVKVMTMEDEPEDRRPFVYSDVSLQSVFVWLLTAPTALLMLNWNVLNQWAQAAARQLLS
jgi:NADH-quinone oxidoreductase subunit N